MIRTLLASALAAGLLVTGASAMTVVNDGPKTASFVFMPKHGKAQHVSLRSHHYRSFDCKAGGSVTYDSHTLDCSAKTAKSHIKGGKLVI